MKKYGNCFLAMFLFPMLTFAEPVAPPVPSPVLSNSPMPSNASSLESLVAKVKAIDFSEWAKYGNNLQNCTPGTYQLPNPIILGMFSMVMEEAVKSGKSAKFPSISEEEFKKDIESTYMTYQILGWNGDKCEVKINLINPSLVNSSDSQMILNCAFPRDKIAVVAKAAVNLGSDASSVSTDDVSSKIMNEACKEVKSQ